MFLSLMNLLQMFPLTAADLRSDYCRRITHNALGTPPPPSFSSFSQSCFSLSMKTVRGSAHSAERQHGYKPITSHFNLKTDQSGGSSVSFCFENINEPAKTSNIWKLSLSSSFCFFHCCHDDDQQSTDLAVCVCLL